MGWIPAHPIYGAVSMRRYWQALNECRRDDDPFRIESIIHPVDVPVPPGVLGMAARHWQRKVAYPSKIRRKFKGQIAHLLDHSWADMLGSLPESAVKIVTVHDLIPLWFPGELTSAQVKRFRSWVNHLQEADAIIAVSHHTKQEIQNLLGITAEKIHVVANGVSTAGGGAGNHSLELPQTTADTLTVGSIGSTIARKNLAILPEAFSKFAVVDGRKIRLVRVGPALSLVLRNELQAILGTGNLIELGHLPDADLAGFYQAMDVVVVPSLSEGFGLPVLEALAYGVPVISSNTTSLPEVGGPSTLYFDPREPAELAARLSEIPPGGRGERWKEEAMARASRYSWRASLEGIFSVYEATIAAAAMHRKDT